MSDKSENGKSNNTSKPSERRSIYENGCHSVPPSKETAPKPPGRQK